MDKHHRAEVPFGAYPDDVALCECWGRDGIQSWTEPLDRGARIALLNDVLAAGFAEVELGAVVPPSTTPQFADLPEILAGVERPDNVETRVLVPNRRGAERLLAVIADVPGRVTGLGMPVSASESHNQANLRKSIDAQVVEIAAVRQLAGAEGLHLVVAIATAFGCPKEGPTPPASVMALAERLADMGVTRIMLSDSTGLADPRASASLFAAAAERLPDVELLAHFHDTRGRGVVNTLAALAAGVRSVDVSLGGTGGEPSSVEHGHRGATGNVCTEDLVSVLLQMGFSTGVSIDTALALGAQAEMVMGRPLRSQVLRSGPGLEAGLSGAGTT